jgi:hypothetical protein
MSILVIVALWTRFWGLAERQLAEDEYYFVTSVRNILEFGVPRFSLGGYYFRGILLQYLTAAAIWIFGDGGFAYRLPSALFGVGTVVMAYFLGRQFFNRSWSIALAAMLTFSSWEIELSRFARMYAPFQFVSVCFFWSLYRYSFNRESTKRYLAVAFAMIAILTHELGVFLGPFLFLPVFAWFSRDLWRTLWQQGFYIVISSMVLVIGLLQATGRLGLDRLSGHLPPDYVAPVTTSPHWSSFGTGLFGETAFFSIGALIAGLLVLWYLVYALRVRASVDAEERLLGGLLVLGACFAVFHQFGMCALILFLVVLRNPRLVAKKPFPYLILFIAAFAAFWLVLLLIGEAGIYADGLGRAIKAYRRSIRINFWAWPDLYFPVIRAWMNHVPTLGLFLALAAVHQVIRIRRSSISAILGNPVVPIVILIILMGVESPHFIETRYSHFIFPLALCVGVLSARELGAMLRRRLAWPERVSKATAMGLCFLAFGLSEDFNAFHLSHMNSDAVAFRIGRYEKFANHWYPRWDFKGPAALVNGSGSESSMVIVSRDVDTISAYLDKEFVLYWRRDGEFSNISREGGTREKWSSRRIVSTPGELAGITEQARFVWLLLYPKWRGMEDVDPEAVWPGRVKSVEVFTPGRDKRIEVWKIELGKQGSS